MGKINLNIIPINGVVFPHQVIKLLIPPSSVFFEKSMIGSFIGICFQKNQNIKNTAPSNLTEIGIAVKVNHEVVETGNLSERQFKMMGGVTLRRFKVKKFVSTSHPLTAEVELFQDDISPEKENELIQSGIVKTLRDVACKYVELLPESEMRVRRKVEYIRAETSVTKLHYTIASYLRISDEEKYKLLETDDVKERIEKIVQILEEEVKMHEVKGDIKKKVNESRQKDVRKDTLKRHLAEINKELYGNDQDELSGLEEKIQSANPPQEVLDIALRELNRLRSMGPRDPDYNVQKKYIETLVELPWSKASEEINDINRAEQILNRDHAGLDKIKKRILEFLAVKILKKNSKGSILCFQGPPGVGKTSLGKSIAESLGRKFERVALGGVRDEAEVRGHRRTYVGAMPGVFVEALLRCKTNNPVILLDEIDKVGNHSLHGDPSSALLEVLDPNQNNTFKDHYLGVPFDLSNVLFIATANTLETIQPALLDRMEVITLEGYTLYEKIEIAKHYLLPKQIKENGLIETHIEFPDDALRFLTDYYTREAGVRTLERKIGSVCRKVAFDYLKTKQSQTENSKITLTTEPFKINEDFIESVLGPKAYDEDISQRIDQPGIAIGMAWTQFGGKILLVEASKAPGHGKIQITGKLGDVMKESVLTSIGWIKAHQELISLITNESKEMKTEIAETLTSDPLLDKYDLHVHFPAAAIPKDGPSAGITITIALISLLTGKKVRNDISMTGEMSLKGAVLPVGGIKEKCLAAYANGIRRVILPERNKKDVDEISKEIRENITFYFVKHISDVITLALDTHLSIEEVENVVRMATSSINKNSKL